MGNNVTIRLNYSDTQPIRLINPDELHRKYLIITNDYSCELVSAYYHASGHFLCFINDKKPKKDSGDTLEIDADYPENGINPDKYKFWGEIPNFSKLNLE